LPPRRFRALRGSPPFPYTTLFRSQAVNVDPIAAMANAAAVSQTLHMTLAAYAATGFAVAGIHAFLLLKDPANAFHRRILEEEERDRKSTRLNSSHRTISYAVFCLK